ncbi:MAG TPA: cytochrome c3 family protein [Candidatus Acidoferrales bacterium]|nr:cytochrome c3 family protein [Candidatus Acidoferrales bacterium]
MAQVFHRSTNTIARLSIYGAAFIIALLGWAVYELSASPYVTEVNVAKDQPIPFSHKHHVGELGLDCRYCHTAVENSSAAGMPPTQTCMTCHSQIWVNSPMLEPVRASYRDDKSIEWIRVNAVPDFVYFNHSIHVNKGIGCVTCHGPVGDMPLTWRANTLQMGWCLDCHRAPEKYVRPRDQVFNIRYQAPENQEELGKKLVKEYKIQSLTNCSTCHR